MLEAEVAKLKDEAIISALRHQEEVCIRNSRTMYVYNLYMYSANQYQKERMLISRRWTSALTVYIIFENYF